MAKQHFQRWYEKDEYLKAFMNFEDVFQPHLHLMFPKLGKQTKGPSE